MVDTRDIIERLSPSFGAEGAKALATVLAGSYEDLRHSLLREEFGELRGAVRELAEAQKRTELRVGRLEQAVVELAQAQRRTEQRVEELAQAQQRTERRVEELVQAQQRTEQRVEELAQAQQRTEQRVEELAQAQQRTERRVEELVQAQTRTEVTLTRLIERVDKHDVRLAKLDGRTLEMQFREKASAYLGKVMRRTRVVPVGDLGDDLDGVLTPEEWSELTRADVILQGRAEIGGQKCDVYAVVEVSVTIGQEDVARAARRAELLRKKGWKALAVAAGEQAAEEVVTGAAQQGVAVLQDGQQFNWTEALATA